MVKLNLPTAKVPQQFEYPMLNYPQSLVDILQQVEDVKPLLVSYDLEAIPYVVSKSKFYRSLNNKYKLYSIVVITILSIVAIILYFSASSIYLVFAALSLLVLVIYLILIDYLNSLSNKANKDNRRLLARRYSLPVLERQTLANKLLLKTTGERESAFNKYKIDRKPKKGILYEYFMFYLRNWFTEPWTIIGNRRVEAGYVSTGEYILISEHYKLAINVEVDEPYQIRTNLPANYREDNFQRLRDRIFVDLGYIVIRFAEYQIANHPHRCCLYLARVANQFLGQNEKVRKPEGIDEDILSPITWRVKTWSKTEAESMAKDKLRQKYLERTLLNYSDITD